MGIYAYIDKVKAHLQDSFNVSNIHKSPLLFISHYIYFNVTT